MKVKPDVDGLRVEPALLCFMGAIAAYYRERVGRELVVLAVAHDEGWRRWSRVYVPRHPLRSFDFLRTELDRRGMTKSFTAELRARWGDWLRVVVEPDELTDGELERRGGRRAVPDCIHVALTRISWPEVL